MTSTLGSLFAFARVDNPNNIGVIETGSKKKLMDARNQADCAATAPVADMTHVFHSSVHPAVSLRPVAVPVSTEMQEKSLFPMTHDPASWARASFAEGPTGDHQLGAMYRDHGQPSFPPQQRRDLQLPPLHPRPDVHLMMATSISSDPSPNHFQQRIPRQHQHIQQHPQQLSDVSECKNASRTEQKESKRNHTNCSTTSTKPTEQKRRCSNSLKWKKREKKMCRDRGAEYITVQGKLKKARTVQPIDCTKCRFRCSEKISEEVRRTIHELYWSLASYERQRAFIAQHVEQNDIKQPKSQTGQPRREVANSFFFVHNRKEYRVCKAFFTKTLDISSKLVDYTMKKTQCGVYVGHDQRGRRVPVNKTKSEDQDFIRWHIQSFPTTADVPCTSSSKGKKSKKKRKRYLSQDLNVVKMYGMYKDLCQQSGRKAMGISVYRNIFKLEFNLAFQKPKKEHCANCKCAEGTGTIKEKGACQSNSNSNNNSTSSICQSLSNNTQPSLFFQ